MQNTNVKPVTGAAAAAIVAFLQPAIDKFAKRATERGFVRLDMGLLADPANSKSEVIEPPLLSRFRTVADALVPQTDEIMKVQELVAFIKAAVPGLSMPTVSFRRFGERDGKTRLDENGNLYTPKLKATTASFFGTPPSSLSPQAQKVNAQLKADFAALLAGAPANVDTTTGEITEPPTDDVI